MASDYQGPLVKAHGRREPSFTLPFKSGHPSSLPRDLSPAQIREGQLILGPVCFHALHLAVITRPPAFSSNWLLEGLFARLVTFSRPLFFWGLR
ncbi:hypothetical protein CEXT_695351 [Caerostris extrusa]|uniref:Uncharacterized protein n=1 Tax=Caerostris extrusa TaxID=172846 RepID=A0AAV4MAX9_CAEEX|nr:hypothetical protein CEXT_695351 [Caerostris extrusa]